MRASRKRAAIISTAVGLFNNVLTLLLTFILRTYVLKYFGNEYVGLYTLLSQTIGILVGIDGGLSSTVMIKMHKPIADNDPQGIQKAYFMVRTIYYIRALLVLTVGSVIGIFIPQIVNTTIDLSYIYKCYFLYLALNSVSYCFIFDYFMLETVQKRYIGSLILCVTNVLMSLVNIVCIKLFENYLLYLLIGVANSVLSYAICSLVFKRMYSDYYQSFHISRSLFAEFKELFGMAVHTLSNTLIKHSDTILMSSVVSLTATGFYSNYHMIISGVNSLAQQLSLSVKDPLRNLSVSADVDTASKTIRRITFFYGIVMGSMCVTFCATADIFVRLFWGVNNLIQSRFTVYLMASSAQLLLVSGPLVDFYYCKELYRIDRSSPVVEVSINLVISFILGLFLGVDGIIIGTIVTYIFRIAYRSAVIEKQMGIRDFSRITYSILRVLLVTAGLCIGFKMLVDKLLHTYTLVMFILSAVIVFCASVGIFCLIYCKTDEYRYFRALLVSICKGIAKKYGNK